MKADEADKKKTEMKEERKNTENMKTQPHSNWMKDGRLRQEHSASTEKLAKREKTHGLKFTEG